MTRRETLIARGMTARRHEDGKVLQSPGPMAFRFLFTALTLLLLARTASAVERRTLRVFCVHNVSNISVSLDLLRPLEKALRDGVAELDSIEMREAFVSDGEFLFAPSSAALGGMPPPSISARREGGIAGLRTHKEILFAEPESPALLNELLRRAKDGSDWDAYAPAASSVTLELSRYPDGSRSARLDSEGAAGRWRPTGSLVYRLKVAGRPVTVRAVGRLLGGPGVFEALKTRLGEAGPALVLQTAWGRLPERYGLPRDLLSRAGDELGPRIVAFRGEDLGPEWDAMARRAARGGVRLLCTNLKPAATGQASPVETFVVEERLGERVGVLSLIDPGAARETRRLKLPFVVQDPVEAARDAVRELRTRHGVEWIILVSHLDPAREADLLERVSVDAVIRSQGHWTVGARRTAAVELENWSRGQHWAPAIVTDMPANTWTELAVDFEGHQPVRVAESAGPVVAESTAPSTLDALLERFLPSYLSNESALPDPRRVWPDLGAPKLDYEPSEFWNLAAAALRRRTGAEVALLRISPLGSNAPGGVRSTYVRHWMEPDQQPVTAVLPGRALSSLVGRLVLPGKPIDPYDVSRRYDTETWLAASGIDSHGRVSGQAINPDELYSVATTRELLERADELPGLKSAGDVLPAGSGLTEPTLEEFKRLGRGPGFEEGVRAAAEGRAPVGLVWRLNLRELAFQMSDTRVENNAPFAEVRDARVQSVNQTLVQGDAKLFSELSWNRLRWDAGVTALYGRAVIEPPGGPSIVNVTQDDLTFETELRHRTWELAREGVKPSLGPYLNVSYETQFTPPPGVPKAKYARYRGGLEAADGGWLEKAYLGPAAESDYSSATGRTHAGYAAGFLLAAPLRGGAATAQWEASYLELFSNGDDRPQDLRRRLKTRISVSLPLYRGLSLNPFIDAYVFQGLAVRETGSSVIFGVSASFARLWKPFF